MRVGRHAIEEPGNCRRRGIVTLNSVEPIIYPRVPADQLRPLPGVCTPTGSALGFYLEHERVDLAADVLVRYGRVRFRFDEEQVHKRSPLFC